MSTLTDMFLTAMLAHGPVALGLALLLAALGVPLPATLLLLAAGAFVRQGTLDGITAAGIGLAASVLGDSGSYCLGRFGSVLVARQMAAHTGWQQAKTTFTRYGGLAVLLTRFALTPLALPTNMIAGSSHYAFQRFLFFDVFGEFIWVLLFGGLGYLFADSWEALGDLAGNLVAMFVGVLILIVGAVTAYRGWKNHRGVG